MAKLMSAGSLLVPLCALLFAFHAALAEMTDIGLPPEDLDSSGDDDDSFSGSGAGSLPAHPVVAWTTQLQESTNSSLMPAVSTDSGYDQPEVQGTDSLTKTYERVHLSATSIPVFPTSDSVADKPAVAFEDERGLAAEQATTRSAVTTTVIPVTDHTSTSTITTSQASSTATITEPRVHLEIHHGVFNADKGVPVSDTLPSSKNGLDAITPTTTSSLLNKSISSLSEVDVAFPGDGSGDKDDPIYLEPDENMEKTDAKDAKSAGAPQGMMERKEVLGGVIAGGLVGLLFAGFLVGFMLYRMKKKDEGSYSLDEPKQSNGGYQKPHKQEEFYA